MRKKFLCMIFVLMLTASLPISSFAQSKLSDTLEFFDGVGIKMDYEIETIKEKQEITRAVFADKIVKLLNMQNRQTKRVYYHDVSKDHWAFNVIGVLTEARILSGTGQSYFNPDQIMTKEQAIKVLVSVLGYDTEAGTKGGYPNGYLSIAYDLGLLKNCSGETNLILSDMLFMFENALNAEISTYTNLSDEDETLMSKYHNAYYDKGTLTGCDNISLTSDEGLLDGVAVIDGVKYTTELRGIIDCLGTGHDEDYTVKNKSNMTSDLAYNAIVYRYTDKNLGYEDVILMYADEWKPLSGTNVLVDKVNDCVNSDGEVVECLIGNKAGADVTYMTDGTVSLRKLGVKSGDIVSVELDTKGQIRDAKIKYDYQKGGILQPSSSSFNATNRFLVAYTHDKSGSALRVGYKNASDFDEAFITTDAKIIVYNPNNRDRIREGTIWDIKTYKTSPLDCSLVYIQTFTATTKSIIVYEK